MPPQIQNMPPVYVQGATQTVFDPAPSMGKGMGKSRAVPPTMPPAPVAAAVPPTMPYEPPLAAPAPRPEEEPQREMIPLIPDKVEEDYTKWHNIRQFVAYMFTLTAFTVFAAPTIISIQLGMDNDAAFWIGQWGKVAIVVPIFLLGQHFYHIWMINNRRERRRYIFFIVPVIPAVLFMIIGGTYMSFARHLYGQLKSGDCTESGPTPGKFYVQRAYDEARAAYDQCLFRLQSDNLGQPLRRHPNLQSCNEWDDLLQREGNTAITPWKGHKVSPGTLRQHIPYNNHRWQYLANVEINHVCGGFCTPGPSLFVSYDHSGRQGGSCAQFIAFRFLSIMHWGTVLFTVGLIVILLAIPTYVMSRNFLNTMGYKSAAVIA